MSMKSLTILFCFCATTAWAGPYSGGQFGLYTIYVFYFLVPPAVLILTFAKTHLWNNQPLAENEHRYLILKVTAAFFISCAETMTALLAAAGLVSLAAMLIPAIDEANRAGISIAMTGWGLFLLIIALLDILHNRWLLERIRRKHPDSNLPAWPVYVGPVIMLIVLTGQVIWLASRPY